MRYFCCHLVSTPRAYSEGYPILKIAFGSNRVRGRKKRKKARNHAVRNAVTPTHTRRRRRRSTSVFDGPDDARPPAAAAFEVPTAGVPTYLVASSAGLATDRNGVSLVNQTDLLELIWVLRRSSFIVSVDSGPMHIGAAITPELLSIHIWSDPGSVGPYNPDAWVWKARRIFQMRSIRSGELWEGNHERPNLAQIARFVRDRLLH